MRFTRRGVLGMAGLMWAGWPMRLFASVAQGEEKKIMANGAAKAPVTAPGLEFCFELFVEIDAPLDLGETHHGHRRIVPIAGGRFEGPRLEGTIVPGGADWQVIHPDGVVDIDTRYTLKTKAGALVYLKNAGLRYATPAVTKRMTAGELVAPSEYYFRTNPVFETSAPELQWMVQSLFVGVAERRPHDVSVQVWRVM